MSRYLFGGLYFCVSWAENQKYMQTSSLHIAVAGNIGAGKTTLVNRLSAHFGWKPHYEAVENNPYLEDFYGDMHRYSFPLQIFFLHSRFNQAIEIRKNEGSVIQDRTIYEDAYIFARNLYESGFLSPRDYGNYFELFKTMIGQMDPPDLLIYLKASVPRLIGQIAQRGREYENSISIKYLEDLNRHYEDWIEEYSLGKLLVININEMDFVKNPDDLGDIVRRVNNELFGLF